uniref:CSON010839 protein n=1 Tax=Culicoides sonorensis TaxID=179676 RepID=A0A336M691_CULSO
MINNQIVSLNNDEQIQVNLVERNPNLNILSLQRTGKKSPNDLVELAQQIQNADLHVRNTASAKLTVIAEQIHFLQQQATRILEEAAMSKELHHGAACNFKKVPGKIYHLYERKSGQRYFSMLSPDEWGDGLQDVYLDSYRLEFDQSWTPVDKLKDGEMYKRWATQLLDKKKINLLAIQGKNDD